MSRIRRLSYAIDSHGRRAASLNQASRLRDTALSIVDDANANVSASRRVTKKAAFTVVLRSLEKTRNLPFSLREHTAMRELSRYINLAQHDRTESLTLSHTDLLPLSHPRSTRQHSMTSSALRSARSRWYSDDPRITDERAQIILASAFSSEPGSVEHTYYSSILSGLAQGVIPAEALIAVGNPFSGGNSSAERSLRARLQRRDRKGQFAFMGGGLSALVRKADGLAYNFLGRPLVDGPDNDDIQMELPDGKIVNIPASKGLFKKATLAKQGQGDGYSTTPAKVSLADKNIINQEDLVFVDSPNGWNKIIRNVWSNGTWEVTKYRNGKFAIHRDSSSGKRETVSGDFDSWDSVLNALDEYDDKEKNKKANLPKPEAQKEKKKFEFDIPEGGYRINQGQEYDPEGRVDEESTDFTDDPAELAQNQDVRDLVSALEQAVLPQDNNKNAFAYGPLRFNRGDELVPANAIYNALKEAGEDADLELARIYDKGLGSNNNEKALLDSRKGAESAGQASPQLEQSFERITEEGASDVAPAAVEEPFVEEERDLTPLPPLLEGMSESELARFTETKDHTPYLPTNEDIEMPEGYNTLNPFPFESWQEITSDNPSDILPEGFSDNPVFLSQEIPKSELLQELRRSIEPGNEAPGYGAISLNTEDGDKFTANVPGEAIRDALQLQGVDTNEEIKKISEEGMLGQKPEGQIAELPLDTPEVPRKLNAYEQLMAENQAAADAVKEREAKLDKDAVDRVDDQGRTVPEGWGFEKRNKPTFGQIDRPENYFNVYGLNNFEAQIDDSGKITLKDRNKVLGEKSYQDWNELQADINNRKEEYAKATREEIKKYAKNDNYSDEQIAAFDSMSQEEIADFFNNPDNHTEAYARALDDFGNAAAVDMPNPAQKARWASFAKEQRIQNQAGDFPDGDSVLPNKKGLIRSEINPVDLKIGDRLDILGRTRVTAVRINPNSGDVMAATKNIGAKGGGFQEFDKNKKIYVWRKAQPQASERKPGIATEGEEGVDTPELIQIEKPELDNLNAKIKKESDYVSNGLRFFRADKGFGDKDDVITVVDDVLDTLVARINPDGGIDWQDDAQFEKYSDAMGEVFNLDSIEYLINALGIRKEIDDEVLLDRRIAGESLDAVAKDLGITREEVRRREMDALRKRQESPSTPDPLDNPENKAALDAFRKEYIKQLLNEEEALADKYQDEEGMDRGDAQAVAETDMKRKYGVTAFEAVNQLSREDAVQLLEERDKEKRNEPVEIKPVGRGLEPVENLPDRIKAIGEIPEPEIIEVPQRRLAEDDPSTQTESVVAIDVNSPNLKEEIQSAIDKGQKIAFSYNGKNRIVLPKSIWTNPKNGNVNLRAIEDGPDGGQKVFTLDKMEMAESTTPPPPVEIKPKELSEGDKAVIKNNAFVEENAGTLQPTEAKNLEVGDFLWAPFFGLYEEILAMESADMGRIKFTVFNVYNNREEIRYFEMGSALHNVRRPGIEDQADPIPSAKAAPRGGKRGLIKRAPLSEQIRAKDGRRIARQKEEEGLFKDINGVPVKPGDVVVHPKHPEWGRGVVKDRIGAQVEVGKKAGGQVRAGVVQPNKLKVQFEAENPYWVLNNAGRELKAGNIEIYSGNYDDLVLDPRFRGGAMVPNPKVDVNPDARSKATPVDIEPDEIKSFNFINADGSLDKNNVRANVKEIADALEQRIFRMPVGDRDRDGIGRAVDVLRRIEIGFDPDKAERLDTESLEAAIKKMQGQAGVEGSAYGKDLDKLVDAMRRRSTELRDKQNIAALDALNKPFANSIPDANNMDAIQLRAAVQEMIDRLPKKGLAYNIQENYLSSIRHGLESFIKGINTNEDIPFAANTDGLGIAISNLENLKNKGMDLPDYAQRILDMGQAVLQYKENNKKNPVKANMPFVDSLAVAEQRVADSANAIDLSSFPNLRQKVANIRGVKYEFMQPHLQEIQEFFAKDNAPMASLSPEARQTLAEYLSTIAHNGSNIGANPEETKANANELGRMLFAIREEKMALNPERDSFANILGPLQQLDKGRLIDEALRLANEMSGDESFQKLIVDGVDTGFFFKRPSLEGINTTYMLIHSETGQIIYMKREGSKERARAEQASLELAKALGIFGVPKFEWHNSKEDVFFLSSAGDNYNFEKIDSGYDYIMVDDLGKVNNAKLVKKMVLADGVAFGVLDGILLNSDRHSVNFLFGINKVNNSNNHEQLQVLPIDHGFAGAINGEKGNINTTPVDHLGSGDGRNGAGIAMALAKSVGAITYKELADLSVQQAIQLFERGEVGKDLDPAMIATILDRLRQFQGIDASKVAQVLGDK